MHCICVFDAIHSSRIPQALKTFEIQRKTIFMISMKNVSSKVNRDIKVKFSL